MIESFELITLFFIQKNQILKYKQSAAKLFLKVTEFNLSKEQS